MNPGIAKAADNHNKASPDPEQRSVFNFLTVFAELHGFTEAVTLFAAIIQGCVCV